MSKRSHTKGAKYSFDSLAGFNNKSTPMNSTIGSSNTSSKKDENIEILNIDGNNTNDENENENNNESTRKMSRSTMLFLISGLIIAALVGLIILVVIHLRKDDSTDKNKSKKQPNNDKVLIEKLTNELNKAHNDINLIKEQANNYEDQLRQISDERNKLIEEKKKGMKPPVDTSAIPADDYYQVPTATKPSENEVTKSREYIKSMVNQKRDTPQDMIDAKKALKDQEIEQKDENVRNVLNNETNAMLYRDVDEKQRIVVNDVNDETLITSIQQGGKLND